MFVAAESETMPKGFQGRLRPGEEFVEGTGHAESTILQHLRDDWPIMEGGMSRNICLRHCAWELGDEGVVLGGEKFRGASDKTDSRMFWRTGEDGG